MLNKKIANRCVKEAKTLNEETKALKEEKSVLKSGRESGREFAADKETAIILNVSRA
jgi:hypothetical protein